MHNVNDYVLNRNRCSARCLVHLIIYIIAGTMTIYNKAQQSVHYFVTLLLSTAPAIAGSLPQGSLQAGWHGSFSYLAE